MTVRPQHQELHAAALQALQDAIDHLPPAYAHLAHMLRDVHDHPEQHWPHPVYLVDLDDLAVADGLSQAQLVGWRYLAQTDGNRNYAIEVQGEPDGANCQFAKMDQGPLVDGIYQVLAEPKLRQRVTAGELQFSVLIINEMDTLAVWLRAQDPAQEIIAAIPPVPAYLQPWPAVYTVEQFQDALRNEARREL